MNGAFRSSRIVTKPTRSRSGSARGAILEPGDRLGRMAKKKQPTTRRKKVSPSRKRSRPKQIVRTPRRSPLVTSLDVEAPSRRGLGAHSAGQSGDTQGLSNAQEADSESVEELVEEGQDFEAGAVAGIEEADASQGEVRTRQVSEDDVPREYLENDLDRLNRKMGEPRGKQMAQKNAKRANRGGRRGSASPRSGG
jgi:hypothetical protein